MFKWHKAVFYTLGFLVLFCGVTITYSLFYHPVGIKQSLRIEPRWGAGQVVGHLYAKRLTQFPYVLKWLLRITDKTEKLQAGVYQVDSTDTAWQIIDKMSRGDVIKSQFTLIAGTTLDQVISKLDHSPFFAESLINLNPFKQERKTAEGLFLAETYQYVGGSSKQQLLMRANQQLIQVLMQLWLQRQANLPYKTPYQMLIAASIIEKETAIAKERPIIASVIVNRLKKSMRLQMDPTVIYALGKNYHGKLRSGDLSVDSSYNTYRYKGLPPTPIAMVSVESIEAAANPSLTNYYYFVATGDGDHQFSATYTNHQQAVKAYRDKIKGITP